MVAQLDGTYRQVAGLRRTLRRLVSYVFFEGRAATTRGQWWNVVVRANLLLGRLVGGRRVDRPIFVVGVGRSGTTHLGKLLSAHRDAGWLNEPKLLWTLVRADEDVTGFYADSGRFVFTPADADATVKRRAHRLVGYYLRLAGARRLVDKYPEMTYRIPFLKTVFPDAKVIAIVRRPEDFVNSVLQWKDAEVVEGHDWWGVGRRKWTLMRDELVRPHPQLGPLFDSLDRDPEPGEMASAEWVLGAECLLAAREHLDLVVQFERLALDPVPTMESVLEACGLDPDERVVELARRSTSSRLRTDPADFGVVADLVARTRARLEV